MKNSINEHYILSTGEFLDQYLLRHSKTPSIYYFTISTITYIFRAGIKKTTEIDRDLKAAIRSMDILLSIEHAERAFAQTCGEYQLNRLTIKEHHRAPFCEIFCDTDYSLDVIYRRTVSWLEWYKTLDAEGLTKLNHKLTKTTYFQTKGEIWTH